MSIRVRLIVLILLVGTLPTLVAVFGTTGYMENLAVSSGQAALEEIGKAAIYDQALTVAGQIDAYLGSHPEVDLSDMAALEANQELAALAVQPVGKTGYTAVFDANGITHFHVNPDIVGMDMSTLAGRLPDFWAIFAASLDGTPADGYYDWEDADGVIRQKFMAVVPVENTPLRVAATTYIDEFSQPAQKIAQELEQVTGLTRRRFILSTLIVGLISLAVAVFVGIWLTAPLRRMAEAAAQVMQGQWDAVRPSRRRDEVGTLSRALYDMTLRIRELVQSLEREVAERTAGLARRARYQEATAAVARDATSMLDLHILLSRVVNLVSERFGFYHTGIFLLDPAGEWAVLQAASSEGGQRMLNRGHRLRVGAQGIVGYVAGRGEHRIALDVDADVTFLDNPELPETRSAVALPLHVRGEIIGVLDVQSREQEAFSDEDVTALQALADQVAVAIDNARLFQQVEESLEAERRAYGELSREGWRELIHAQPDLAFLSDAEDTVPAGDLWRSEMMTTLRTGRTTPGDKDEATLAVPIVVRGQVIGVIDGRKRDDKGEWTPEEIELLEVLTEQLNVALEGARLYRDAQRRAARERIAREITGKLRSAVEVDELLQTAIRETAAVLGASRAFVQWIPSPSDRPAEEAEHDV